MYMIILSTFVNNNNDNNDLTLYFLYYRYNKASHPILRRPKENDDIVKRKGLSAVDIAGESEDEDRDFGADVSEEEDVEY